MHYGLYDDEYVVIGLDKPTATIPAATTDTPAATDAPVGIPGCSGGMCNNNTEMWDKF